MMNPAEFANIAASERDFWWYRGMRRILFRLLEPHLAGRRVDRVLEAGCGTGYFAQVLAERYGWKMFPADLGWNGLRYARAMGLDRLAQADIGVLPYRDASFDAVVSMDVIVHFPPGEEHRPVEEFARVLRPGGLLILRVSALDVLRSRHSQFAHERQRFTRGRLARLVTQAGFRIHRLTYANSLLMPVSLFKFRVWEPLTGAAPASGVAPVPGWLDRLLYSPLALESEYLAHFSSFPLGQSLVLIAER